MEERTIFEHSLVMENRTKLSVSGITGMGGSTENSVEARLPGCELSVKGDELRVTRLDVELGELIIEGQIYSISYTDTSTSGTGGLFGRLFR